MCDFWFLLLIRKYTTFDQEAQVLVFYLEWPCRKEHAVGVLANRAHSTLVGDNGRGRRHFYTTKLWCGGRGDVYRVGNCHTVGTLPLSGEISESPTVRRGDFATKYCVGSLCLTRCSMLARSHLSHQLHDHVAQTRSPGATRPPTVTPTAVVGWHDCVSAPELIGSWWCSSW